MYFDLPNSALDNNSILFQFLFPNFGSAVYPSLNPLAIKALARSFTPPIDDFESEKIKCLNVFPYCFMSFLSNSRILSIKVSVFGETSFNVSIKSLYISGLCNFLKYS